MKFLLLILKFFLLITLWPLIIPSFVIGLIGYFIYAGILQGAAKASDYINWLTSTK